MKRLETQVSIKILQFMRQFLHPVQESSYFTGALIADEAK